LLCRNEPISQFKIDEEFRMKSRLICKTHSIGTLVSKRVVRIAFCVSISLSFVPASRGQSQVFPKWTVNFDDAAAFSSQPLAAADATGNLIIATSTLSESVAVKYDANGNVLWKNWLSGPVSAVPVSVGLDSASNVYVLSQLVLSSINTPNYVNQVTDAALAKYSATGTRDWVDYVSSDASFARGPIALAVSSNGDAYIAVATSGLQVLSNHDVIYKFDGTGKQIWSKTADASSKPDALNVAFGIHLDAQENVFVLVSNDPEGTAIVEFDKNGNLLRTFGSSDLGQPRGFQVDPEGNSYYIGGGAISSAGFEDDVVAKFLPDGSTAWIDDLGPAPTLLISENGGSANNLKSIAIDEDGEVFIVRDLPGAVVGNMGTDMAVTKFDIGGNQKWTSRFNTSGAADSAANRAIALVVNSIGDSYLTGVAEIGDDGDDETVTVKFGMEGQQFWVQTIPAFAGGPLAMVAGGLGTLFVESSLRTAPSVPTGLSTTAYVQDAAQFSASTITFASQTVKTMSAAQTVTLTNSAEVPLVISDINADGDFTLSSDGCPTTVAPGASCPLKVTFTPTETGVRSGVLSIRDNWAGSAVNPRFVRLNGTGVQ
jgi:Abnormal spindle-like microcephaly-assoc'd, ASPM-SPD-2-Hydin